MAEQENNMEMVQFEFPDEDDGEVKQTPIEETEEYKKAYAEAYKREMEKHMPELEADEDDVEEVDDTPEEDRGREPLPEDVVNELERDELNDYSERVRTRMSQLKKVWHDERRAKEATQREREEAVRIAQQIVEENKRLRATLSSGEEILMQTMKEAAERELEIARREYREAYDAGDSERIIEAQQRLNSAQFRAHQTAQYQPAYANQKYLQEEQNVVNSNQERPQVPQPDPKAVAWQKRNSWFGSDEEMTSLALGLHEKLVKGGVDPKSDDYYRRIDTTMRKRFPEYFGSTQASPRAKPAQVVAPATRSTAPKKVVLTKTQVNLARKLGITPEQYARELIKENANG